MKPSRLLFLIALALGIALPLRAWVLEPIYIASASMEPTLPVGRRLFADKLSLRLREPRRGEIIVFRSPVGEGEFVKRVVALPGETVELRRKKLFIDGRPVEEQYVRHSRPDERLVGDDLGPLAVPAESYFVLGDNRDESEDSAVWRDADGRPVHFLPRANIVGLVRGIF